MNIAFIKSNLVEDNMNFLVVTEPDDIHAIYVTLALESKGHQVVNFFCADFPTAQKNSVFIDNRDYRCQSEEKYRVIEHVGYDVVWWRRPRRPYLEKEKVYADDYKFHERENLMFHDCFTHQLAPRAWWINRKEAAIRSNYKLLQLKLACDMGMIIPTTLCSNSLSEIKEFYLHHQKTGIIYKPLTYQFWDEGDGLRVCYTSKINDLDIIEQCKVDLIPGIYQAQIQKSYELRVTCFGDFMIAVKIHSQDYQEGKIDWRQLKAHQLKVEPYELPAYLKQQIRYLMRELGIVFGCLDFIVTPDGQFIFLEVNEQGQFLFIEQLCPDLPMLDIFVSFLLQQTINFHWSKGKNNISMSQFGGLIARHLEDNKARHVDVRALVQAKSKKRVS
jgi:glutathione synthase/RimK-type ligase-like ATP-grasp enzyme